MIREIDISTRSHSTCTFEVPGQPLALEQRGIANRKRSGTDDMAPPLASPSRRLLATADGPLRVTISDAAGRYGHPIEEFTRISILCGSHVLFVVDRILASVPVRTKWNWMLNNRDDRGELKVITPDRILFRRGDAALKIFNSSGAHLGGPQYGFVHDAYHPLPSQLGEGRIGSGILMHWREPTPLHNRTVVHAIAIDDSGRIAGWHHQSQGQTNTLRGRKDENWSLEIAESSNELLITRQPGDWKWSIRENASGSWKVQRS